MSTDAGWTSVEIVKVAVSALVPVSVAVFGWWVTRLSKRLDASQWLNQKVIEKRIAIVDEVAPLLNDLLCYFTWVGAWKELSPLEVVERKRRLERAFSIHRPYLSQRAQDAWTAFKKELFKETAAPGEDARLKTWLRTHDGDRVKAYGGAQWVSEWTTRFTLADDFGDQSATASAKATIRERYADLLDRLGDDIGASPKPASG